MRFATYQVDTPIGASHRVGVVDADSIIDIAAGVSRLAEVGRGYREDSLARLFSSKGMEAVLRLGDNAIDIAQTLIAAGFDLDSFSPQGGRIRYQSAEITLLSPLTRPNSIRDFSVFEEHASQFEKPEVWYEIPTYYKGNPESIIHPNTALEWPNWVNRLDFELEVAAIIGKEGRNISQDDAKDHIAGYTIFNDFTARDYQNYEMKMPFGPAKSKDFANSFGPYIISAKEFKAESAEVRVVVNGEEWMSGSLSNMYHSWEEMIHHASRSERLVPGDVLGSGTVPGGCGLDLDRWVSQGDVVELHVEGIGALKHKIER